MRRTVLGSLVVIASLLVPTSASAASSTTVVSRFGVPSPFVFSTGTTTCGTGPFAAAIHHVKGPATPPLGRGSLQVSVGKNSAGDLRADLSADHDKLGDLNALSVSSFVPKSSAGMTNLVVIVTLPRANGDYYSLATQLPGAVGEWTPLDALNPQVDFNWTQFDQSGTPGTSGTSTYADFTSAHPALFLKTLNITATNCSTAGKVLDLDALRYGLKSKTTTVNFEAPIATHLVGHVSSKLIRYRKAVTPTAKLTAGGHGIGNATVSLWQKRAGAKHYKKIGALVSGPGGGLTGPVRHPRVNTAYQWRYAGDNTSHSAARSKPTHVAVRNKVRLALERKSVSNGQPIAGGGAVKPRHNHLKITLWARKVISQHKRGAPLKVGTTKLRRDGTYAVHGKLGPGSYKVFTTTAADKTNAEGRSHSHNFTVRH